VRVRRLLALGCVTVIAGCGGDAPSVSPSTLVPPAASGPSLSVGPSDYHEDPMPMPDPAPAPPSPSTAVTIAIVGSAGAAAFMPNPLQASAGATIVWTNSDTRQHHIMLSDGTAIGTLGPGESSAPMTLTAASASYHCTIHPSMVGTIQDGTAGAPPAPAPPPDYEPAPDDPYDDY